MKLFVALKRRRAVTVLKSIAGNIVRVMPVLTSLRGSLYTNPAP